MRGIRKVQLGKWATALLLLGLTTLIISLCFVVFGSDDSSRRAAGSFLVVAFVFVLLSVLVELRSRFVRSAHTPSSTSDPSFLRRQSRFRSLVTREGDWIRAAAQKLGGQDPRLYRPSIFRRRREQKRVALRRAVRLAVEAGSCRRLFSEEDLRQIVPELIQDDPLTAFWLLDEAEAIGILALTPRRRLSIELRALGYLGKSLKVLESVAAVTSTERDLRALDSRRSELAVFRGEYVSKLRSNDGVLDPIPGQVLHIVGKALPRTESGYTLRTHYTARALRDLGFGVSVVSQVGESPELNRSEAVSLDDVTYYMIPGSSRSNRSYIDWLDENIERVRDVVERARPAILHAHSDFFNAITAQAVGNHFRIPVIYENRGFWEESWISRTSQKYGIKKWTETERRWGPPDAYTLRRDREVEARSQSAHIVTLADVMKDHINSFGYPVGHISVVPNAVSAESFPVLSTECNPLRRRFGISDEAITIGYISSIVEYEGIDTLLKAFYEVKDRTSRSVRLVIVGDGPHLKVLKALDKQLGRSGVTFTGRVPHDEILDYYGLIDIFVVPRRPSRVCQLVTPLKPFEAFSTGRTVVMSDVAALKEIALDSEAAAVFTAGDKDSLSEVLLELIEDENQRAMLACAGAVWVRKERTWASNAERYSEIYGAFNVFPCSTLSMSTQDAERGDYDGAGR